MALTVRAGDRYSRCPEEQLSLYIPLPIHRRLGDLCDLVEEAGGGRIDKKQLVAAVLRAAIVEVDRSGPDVLKDLVDEYRNGRAMEVMAEPPADEDEVVEYEPPVRGRRRQSPRPSLR